MKKWNVVFSIPFLFAAWPAAAVSVKTTMANAELVFPEVAPMQAIEAVQDALSSWIGSAPMSLKPIPSPLPTRPDKPGAIKGTIGYTPVEILDCPTAVAEIRQEPAPTRTQMSYNGDLFQACVYPFEKGAKVYLRAVNIDAADSSITHGLFSGIAKAIRGTPGEWLTRRLNDFIEAMKKKLPVVLVERIEAPGLPVQTPDRDAVAALLPPLSPATTPVAPVPQAPAAQATPVMQASGQTDKTALMLDARKNLTAMGLTYHNQAQFLDAVRRKDALAVKLFLDGGGVDLTARTPDGKTALELAREAGADEIVTLLEGRTSDAGTAVAQNASPRSLPPGAIPASALMPQLTPEQQAQLRQQLIEAIRQQQSR